MKAFLELYKPPFFSNETTIEILDSDDANLCFRMSSLQSTALAILAVLFLMMN